MKLLLYTKTICNLYLFEKETNKNTKKNVEPFFRKFLRRFRERARGRKNNTHTEQTEIVRTNEITICKPKRKKRIERIGCSMRFKPGTLRFSFFSLMLFLKKEKIIII